MPRSVARMTPNGCWPTRRNTRGRRSHCTSRSGRFPGRGSRPPRVWSAVRLNWHCSRPTMHTRRDSTPSKPKHCTTPRGSATAPSRIGLRHLPIRFRATSSRSRPATPRRSQRPILVRSTRRARNSRRQASCCPPRTPRRWRRRCTTAQATVGRAWSLPPEHCGLPISAAARRRRPSKPPHGHCR